MVDIVIVEPEIPGNLGAIARAMKNFGQERLVVVNPRFSMDDPDLKCRAKHANDVLEDAKVVESIKMLDYDHKIGTTGKLSSDYNLRRTPMTPKELVSCLKGIDVSRAAIFFGRETHGLTNEEMDMMDFVVNIPADPGYGIMNLSHSVAIILYELYSDEGQERLKGRYKPIGNDEKKTIERLHNEILDELDLESESKRNTQKTLFKKMVAKSMLSNREGHALLGLLRRIKERIKKD